MKRLITLLYSLTLVAVLLIPSSMNSCLPEFPVAIFTYNSRPGQPVSWYAHGNLGVLRPTYERGYLAIAYRYLQGHPLSAREMRDALHFMKDSIQGVPEPDTKEEDPANVWMAERAVVLGKNADKAKINMAPPYYADSDYANCLADSFRTAVLTLRGRIKSAGAGSADVREWIRGQDVVFLDCSKEKIIPAMVADDRPAWLKADRRYQQAAAYLYSGGFDQAAQLFDQIAQDNASPWHVIAPYLAARAMVRKAMLPEEKIDKAILSKAETRLRQVLKDPARRAAHGPARKMLGYVTFHLDPLKRTHELAQLLSGPRADSNFYQDLIDYMRGMDRAWGEEPYFGDPGVSAFKEHALGVQWKRDQYLELAQFRGGDAMSDWIFTFRDSGKASRDHAVKIWRKNGSLAWLVAALDKVDASDAAAADLLEAAERVPAGSPAHTTVSYHMVRLLIAKGEQEKARKALDDLLPELRRSITPSSWNMFLSQRMQVAASLSEFLTYASRKVIDFKVDIRGWEEDYCRSKGCVDRLYGGRKSQAQSRFDLDAALVLNTRMPLELLVKSALDETLPERLRGELALATWTRATMLGRHDIATILVPGIEKAHTEMKDDLESYAHAESPQSQWHAALLTILHFPGARPYVNAGLARTTDIGTIDNFRDNWWCDDMGQYLETAGGDLYWEAKDATRKGHERADLPSYLGFLSTEEKEAARSQWRTLDAFGTAANYLPEQTLNWARENPDDPRVPVALHFSVLSTRYGCEDQGTSRLSKEAFRLLHDQYPSSKWAKQTPYWF